MRGMSVKCLTSDISNALSRTDGISQLYGCLRGGSMVNISGTHLKLKRTSTVMYWDKQLFKYEFECLNC